MTGLAATAFDHFDSRAGDPHLHTHVVISNKVQTVLDGKWRRLDGRPMHAAVVALSESHERCSPTTWHASSASNGKRATSAATIDHHEA